MKPIRWHFAIEHLWGLTALVGVFIFVNTHPIRPQDFWWHMAVGREILSSGKIPTTDIYSYTAAGQPYPSYQMFWLMDVTLYAIYRLGGPALVVFIHSLIVTSAYFVIFWLCRQASHSWRVAASGVIFAAALGLNDWNVRPQGITFLLGSLFLLAIYSYRNKPRLGWLIVLPVGMLLWVNSHGTFIIGLALVGIWLGDEAWKIIKAYYDHQEGVNIKALLAPGGMLGITALVCLLNPRGPGIISYIKTLTSNSAVQNLVIEWAPPTLNSLFGALFLVGLLVSAVVLAISPRRPNFFELATFLIFGLLGLKTSRGIVWFGMTMAPILAQHLSALANQIDKQDKTRIRTGGSRVLNVVFVMLLLLLGIISLPWFKSALPLPTMKAGLISAETPVLATQALLDQKPPGHVFHAMSFGSYLIWAAYPEYQVFVDSRIELYATKTWVDYIEISNASGDWMSRLDDYGVNTLMLSAVEQPGLLQAVQASGEWVMEYQDPAATIFVRK